jgi:hypothetical protein
MGCRPAGLQLSKCKIIVAIDLVEGFWVQKWVVWALMLRETKILLGKYRLGYLWAKSWLHLSLL